MVYGDPATVSPASRDSAPLNASLPTSEPPLEIEYVRAGSASPYSFDFASAVTVIGLAVMVRSADTNVMV